MAEKRKLLRIKNDFQQRLILQTLSAVFISINVIVIYLFLGPLSSGLVRTDIIGPVIAILEVVSFALVYRFSLIASHRIAGPIFVLERGLKRLAEGDLTVELSLRKNDNFHDAIEVFNLTVADLRERVIRTKKLVDNPEDASAMEDARVALAEFRTGLEGSADSNKDH